MDYITILNDDIIFTIAKSILINIRDINTVNNLILVYESFKRVFYNNVIYHILLGDKNLISTFNKSVSSS